MIGSHFWNAPDFQQTAALASNLANKYGAKMRIFFSDGHYFTRLATAPFTGEHVSYVFPAHTSHSVQS